MTRDVLIVVIPIYEDSATSSTLVAEDLNQHLFMERNLDPQFQIMRDVPESESVRVSVGERSVAISY